MPRQIVLYKSLGYIYRISGVKELVEKMDIKAKYFFLFYYYEIKWKKGVTKDGFDEFQVWGTVYV